MYKLSLALRDRANSRVRKSELISYVLVKQALTFFGALMMKVTQMLLT